MNAATFQTQLFIKKCVRILTTFAWNNTKYIFMIFSRALLKNLKRRFAA